MLACAVSLSAFSGCVIGMNNNNTRSIVSIEKTASVGLTDSYTITYSDGTTSSFTITNGKDGENVTALDAYNTYKAQYPDDDISYADFCKKYLSVDSNSSGSAVSGATAVSSALRSTLKVYSIFKESTTNSLTNTTVTKNAIYSGSSVIYEVGEEYTYLLTNFHVVYDEDSDIAYDKDGDHFADTIYAYLYGSESNPYQDTSNSIVVDSYAIACECIGASVTYDVAVLRAKTTDVKKVNPNACAVTVNTQYTVGEEVFAVGNPDSEGLSVTRGIVSVYSEEVQLNLDGTTRNYRVLRTDADLDHGSSGGGLFNLNGELIALCNSGREDIASINNAIPASAVKGSADSIIYNYLAGSGSSVKATKMLLGVTVSMKNVRYVYDEKTQTGKIVEDITVSEESVSGGHNPQSGKPAEAMGLQVGDVLTAITINGKEFTLYRNYDLGDALLTARAGDSVTITYIRNGQEQISQPYTVKTGDLLEV